MAQSRVIFFCSPTYKSMYRLPNSIRDNHFIRFSKSLVRASSCMINHSVTRFCHHQSLILIICLYVVLIICPGVVHNNTFTQQISSKRAQNSHLFLHISFTNPSTFMFLLRRRTEETSTARYVAYPTP